MRDTREAPSGEAAGVEGREASAARERVDLSDLGSLWK